MSVSSPSSPGCCFPEAGERAWAARHRILQSNSTGSFGPETVTLSASPEAFGSDALLRNQHVLGIGTFVDVLANAPVLDAFDTASAADAIEPVIEATPTSNQTTAETGETATHLTEVKPRTAK